MASRLKIHTRVLYENVKVRFVLAGILNTVVDFAAFNTFIIVFSLANGWANIASTSIAMVVSYLINRRAVFRNTDPHKIKEFLLFIAVTATGLWGVQTFIVVHGSAMFTSLLEHTDYITLHPEHLHWLASNMAKAMAILFGVVWNYMWYSRLVFRAAHQKQKGEVKK